jgi:hypothetical protein
MVSRDVAALFMEHMPDDKISSLRDSIAKAEAELTAPLWERHRDLHGRIEELKDKCEEAAHSLTIVLAGNVGTRRRLLRNVRNERRTCIIMRDRGGRYTGDRLPPSVLVPKGGVEI